LTSVNSILVVLQDGHAALAEEEEAKAAQATAAAGESKGDDDENDNLEEGEGEREEGEGDGRGAARLLSIAAARRLRLFSHDLLLRSYSLAPTPAPAAALHTAPGLDDVDDDDAELLPPLPAPIRALYERAGRVLESVRSRVPRVVLYIPAAPSAPAPGQTIQVSMSCITGHPRADLSLSMSLSWLCCRRGHMRTPTPRHRWPASACS